MREIRIGLLGFGSMGRTHTWAVNNLPYFYGDLPFTAISRSVCTTSMEKSKKVAEQFGFTNPTNDENDIINDPEIDVIDICTPNNCHFETLKKAIASGKSILCEKPLCISRDEAKIIAEIPLQKGQIVGMEFNYRWMAPVLRAKQLIDDGKIGRILTFDAQYLHSSATDLSKNAGWKQDKDICGGGVLFDLGSHVIDLMHYLCGEFHTVSGVSQICYPTRKGRNGEEWKTNAEESFYLTGITKDGAVGRISVGKIQVGTNDDLSFAVYGEKGALRFSLMEPNWLYFYDNTESGEPIGGLKGFKRIECVGKYPDRIFPSLKAPAGWLSSHLQSIYTFLSCVDKKDAFHPDFNDGYYVQCVMDSALQSANNMAIMTAVNFR